LLLWQCAASFRAQRRGERNAREAFSIDCRRTGSVARQDLGVDEKDLEHAVGLLMDGRPD
jgi:hypothetical protein